MKTALYIPAAEADYAETVYRLAHSGEIPLPEGVHSLEACRRLVASFGADVRQRLSIWHVAERFGPFGSMVVAARVAENVIPMPRRIVG
ncbi:hypothetical protein GGC47_001071 [Bosea sp. OAE752]|uniref:hypothetical protein n=1 Tax=Bosea sp. OAE752 TaxID=2663873 RepID=UPI003D1E240D